MIKFLDLYSQYLSIRSEIDNAIARTIKQSERSMKKGEKNANRTCC